MYDLRYHVTAMDWVQETGMQYSFDFLHNHLGEEKVNFKVRKKCLENSW